MSIQIENLSKIYGTQTAVDDVSFTAKKGQVTGFLGPNGAGKSTTLKIATSYLPPSSGTVRVCGRDVVKEAAAVRRLIGYLPEHNPLYLEQYVWEYLRFIAKLYKVSDAKSRMAETIERCGLEREQHKQIGTLSKGYRQRVGLAQALLHDPEVLILDEPTTGLDPNQIVEIREVIREVSAEKTVIFSTHILSEVQALCDQVVIINKGKIVANDTMTALNQRSGNARFKISFAEPLNAQKIQTLEDVKGVEYDENENAFWVNAQNDPRKALFHLAVAENNPILELKQEKESLESIFKGLTG